MRLRRQNLLVVALLAALLSFFGQDVAARVLSFTPQEAHSPEISQEDSLGNVLRASPNDTEHTQDAEHAEEVETLDPVHHNSDANYLDFSPFRSLELPRIFLVRRTDGSTGLDFFGSTTAAIDRGGYVPHMEEGEHGTVLDAKLAPAAGNVLVDFSITKHLVFAWLGALIVLLVFIRLARMYGRGLGRKTAPKGIFQNMMESLIMFVRDDIARPILGNKSDKYLPYLLTAFFFILTCNLLGLIPYGATATSNLMVTVVLASFTFLITQFGGTKDYWKHIFWPPDAPVLVKLILMPVEILGLFTKPFALAVRLFANMTAGHLVILSLIGLIFAFNNLFGAAAGYGVVPISVAFALFINLLEILVACIQAYVFTMLSALFIGMAVQEHDHADHEHMARDASDSPGQIEQNSSAGKSVESQMEPAVA